MELTIGQKLHQTLNSLETAAAEMKTYALDTQDKTAQQMFSNYARQLEDIARGLRGRVNYVESQEPQYKVYEQQQKQ
ncbi:MAG: DUF1657 domain-containing protein [Desulfotomaculales bacterium]